ncbi:hypothetical protein H6F92_06255 [Microcystis wesenbergii FACHB-1317]|uniref:hypothetical protein n=1 Tax=Microcystis TaxID=1125 RepID=UPI0016800358|nr:MULTISPECIES: hypothetical protein [Microcystis]MBD2288439.1 hypothetical protein [Microcystis wesenbergii FACHB-1317]UZO79133.1 hypothetical protein M8120_12660 [Microcystis aeruginosa str. Chao 1910]
MANKLKFHLDESVSNAIAKGLRMRGIDITTSPEEGLIGASDKEQLGSAEKVFPGGRSQESGVRSRSFRALLPLFFVLSYVLQEG